MPSKKRSQRTFNGLSYTAVQRANTQKRAQLPKDKQAWLKANGYKNVGWEQVIRLSEKLKELTREAQIEDMSLEELFLEADRIGNKYLTSEEINQFNQQLAQEAAEIGELVDRQFPDTEIEIVDFERTALKSGRKRSQKTR